MVETQQHVRVPIIPYVGGVLLDPFKIGPLSLDLFEFSILPKNPPNHPSLEVPRIALRLRLLGKHGRNRDLAVF